MEQVNVRWRVVLIEFSGFQSSTLEIVTNKNEILV